MLSQAKKILFFAGLGLMFLFGCRQDDLSNLKTDNWDPEFALPLIDSRFGIDRIMSRYNETGFLTSDEDNVVTIVYRGRIFEIQASEVINLEDVGFDLSLAQGRIVMPNAGLRLKSIEFNRGMLHVEAEHMISEAVEVTISMPDNQKNGVAFAERFIIPFDGAAPSAKDTAFDLTGYNLGLDNGGSEVNSLEIMYEAHKVSDHASVNLSKCVTTFENMGYSFLDGNFGELDFGLYDDTLKIDVFDKFKSGTILLEDPRFELRFENSFGMPVKTTIGNFSGSGVGGTSNLTGPQVTSGINVNAPINRSGGSKVTVTEFNSGNSNVANFLSISPNTINFNFGVLANANADTNSYNFAFDTSKISGDLSLDIPLKGSLDSVIIEDDYEYKATDFQNVKVALFKIQTTNSFPLGIYFQLYFMDEAFHKIDSLILDNDVILKEAFTDVNGFSIKPAINENQMAIGELRFREITKRATKMRIRAMLLSSDSKIKNVKITTDNFFHFKIGVRAVVTYVQ